MATRRTISRMALVGLALWAASATAATTAARADEKVDINSASADQLVALPGIGKVIAEGIIDYRTTNGPFTSVEDLLKVPKIGPATLEKLRPYIYVGAGAGTGTPTPTPPPGPGPVHKTVGTVTSAAADAAGAMPRETVLAIMDRFADEPSITEVHHKVATYASVHPEMLESLSRRATLAAALPTLRFQVVRRVERDESADFSAGSPDAFGVDTDNDLFVYGWATWNLDRLVFHPSEVALSGKVSTIARARDDLLSLATKLYFERRKLQVDLMLTPPTTVAAAVRSELKLQELTAQLDALTGGWFSRAVSKTKGSGK